MEAKNLNLRNSLTLQLAQVKDRTARLVDGYLDQVVDKSLFATRKEALLMEERVLSEKIGQLSIQERDFAVEATEILELAKTALLSYENGNPDEKRALLKIITSKREAEGKNLLFKPSIPFCFFIDWTKTENCAVYRARPRTLERMFQQFWGWITSPHRVSDKTGIC